MNRCVVVGGANIFDVLYIKAELRPDDWFVFCDSGLRHRDILGVEPNLIVGDFDSHDRIETKIETIVLPREKDDTDTVFAVKTALQRGFDDFILIGVVGARLDHTLGNIGILNMLFTKGRRAKIIDDYSEMLIVGKNGEDIDSSYQFFSLLNVTGIARNVSITNAKYLLENGEITSDYQYGISNEVLPNKVAHVSVGEGRALLIKVRKNNL